jgi:hypothetical protein
MTHPTDSLNDEPPMTSHRDTLLEVKEALEACGSCLRYGGIPDPIILCENKHWQAASRKALAKLDTLLEAPPADMVGEYRRLFSMYGHGARNGKGLGR